MKINTLWINSLLLLLAVLVFFLLLNKGVYTSTSNSSPTLYTNSYVIKGYFKDYDKKGMLHTQVWSSQEQQLSNQVSHFVTPRILTMNSHQIVWHISSDYGLNHHQQRKVKLYGHVKLFRPAQRQHSPLTIHTPWLYYYPSQQLATTTANVTVNRPNSVLTGKGMIAHLDTGQVKVLHDTHIVWHPTLTKATR